jgi:hypothetical protein
MLEDGNIQGSHVVYILSRAQVTYKKRFGLVIGFIDYSLYNYL